ncbi:MAG: peptidylprolyl isomerase [Deltaproteobacteria bacterium]|nr:peptidylprolyl isomerase [Myxococcales bacterium]MDP3218171.1 peptidylprolyl isomerase [Deltaproteobacteria bacterium]
MRSGWLVGLALHLAGAGAWADEVLERVVCVVDDDAIFLSELERRARPFLVGIPAGIPPRAHAAQRAEVLRTALDQRIDELLFRRAATRAHLTVTEADVDEFIGRLASERGATPEQVYAALQREGVSRAEYRTYMESELLQLRVLQLRVRGRINVTEADLQQAYRRAVREAAHRTVPTVAHVLIAVAEDATPAQVEAARQRAERVAQLVRAGEDLRSLARQMSDDAESRENGGALGELPPGSLPEALDEAIALLALGGVTDPVRGPAGWHVIRLASRRALEPPPFVSVRERLYAALVNREMLRQRGIYLRELRRTVSIDNRLADFPAPEH